MTWSEQEHGGSGLAALAATLSLYPDSDNALRASRSRLVAAADEARRRIERDLHDGAQQRLVTLALELRVAVRDQAATVTELRTALADAADAVALALDELQEISRGLHPSILTQGGIGPALRSLSRRCALPVDLAVATTERLPEPVEVATYYIASELLTNAVKHAHASAVRISVTQRDDALLLTVRDDGVGGADPRRGSGLTGLRDRAEALGGAMLVQSPIGAGTTVAVFLPLGGAGSRVLRIRGDHRRVIALSH
jgi:signal transduction histidine kinase